jgi:hypothetical protein
MSGNATGKGGASFSMQFAGEAQTQGRFAGSGNQSASGTGKAKTEDK